MSESGFVIDDRLRKNVAVNSTMTYSAPAWYRDEKEELRQIIAKQDKEIRRLQRELQDAKRKRR